MTTNVEFYEKLKSVQDFQHNSESKRLELEKQLNHYMKSDHRLARLKAVRLQNYWKKLCEDEKRSEWRNEQLVKDIERVENQMASLSARTDRLKTMKLQYEQYIERVYPQWKEKVMAFQEFKKQQAQADVEKYAAAAEALQQGSAMPGTGFPATSTPMTSRDFTAAIQQPTLQQQMGLGVQQQQPPLFYHQQQRHPQGQGLPLYQQQQQHFAPANVVQQQHLMPQQQNYGQLQNWAVPDVRIQGPPGMGPGASPGTTMQTVSDLPTGYSLTSNEHQEQQPVQRLAQRPNISAGTKESSAFNTGEYGVPSAYQDPPVTQPDVQQMPETPRVEEEDTWRSDDPTPRTPRGSVETLDEVPAAGDDVSPREAGGSLPLYANIPPPPDDDFADTSEFASDVELPLSGQEEVEKATPVPTPRSLRSDSVKSRESVEHNVVSRQSSSGQGQGRSSRQGSVDPPKPVYPQADVTLEGLYNLLAAVQETFPGAFSPDEFYRYQLPAMANRKDVISNANRGATLSHIGGESMSMVILDQLPLVCCNLEGGCLLPDDMSYKNLHPASQTLWDKLCQHWTKMIKYSIMSPGEVATIFAPLIIAQDSTEEGRAKEVLVSLLENLPSEDLQPSPNSSAALSLPLSPKGKPTFAYQGNASPGDEQTDVKQPIPEVEVEPPQPMGISLTQTAAYRQLLGDTVSTQRSVTYEDSDDSSADSVEKALKAHSLAASLKSEAPASARKASEPMVVPTGLAEERDVSEVSSARDTGYMPTGLDTGKSTVSFVSTSRSAKSPGFRIGDSDTDEDIEIPGMGTGASHKHGEDKDDFNFYE